VVVRCTADDGMVPMATAGDWRGKIDGQQVEFRAEAPLPAGAKATVRVLLRSDQPRQSRLQVTASSCSRCWRRCCACCSARLGLR